MQYLAIAVGLVFGIIVAAGLETELNRQKCQDQPTLEICKDVKK